MGVQVPHPAFLLTVIGHSASGEKLTSPETVPSIRGVTKLQYEIVRTTAGAISIRDNEVNEIMHNPVGPWVEANALYIDQSRLKERLLSPDLDELVIFDVGLGAASNAIAILHCIRSLKLSPQKTIKIISYERNLDLLKFAFLHQKQFPHFKGFENATEAILNNHCWSEPSVSWKLRYGNFTELIDDEVERPHIIFFDPYSPKVNQDMWTESIFHKLFARKRDDEKGGTTLYTYSQATPVRVALLVAGFFVGQGSGTGLKQETTQASTQFGHLSAPLGTRWLQRWEASHTRYPFDCMPEHEENIRNQILNHRQFAV